MDLSWTSSAKEYMYIQIYRGIKKSLGYCRSSSLKFSETSMKEFRLMTLGGRSIRVRNFLLLLQISQIDRDLLKDELSTAINVGIYATTAGKPNNPLKFIRSYIMYICVNQIINCSCFVYKQ